MGVRGLRSLALATAVCGFPAVLLLKDWGVCDGECHAPLQPKTPAPLPPPQAVIPPPSATPLPPPRAVTAGGAAVGGGVLRAPDTLAWDGSGVDGVLVSSLAGSARRKGCGPPAPRSAPLLPPDPLSAAMEPFSARPTSGGGSVVTMRSAPHPACAGQEALRRAGVLVPHWVPAPRPCRRWPFGEPRGVDWRSGDFHLVSGAALWRGRLWLPHGAERRELSVGGYFVALKGLTRQGTVQKVVLEPLPRGVPVARTVARAVYQPPTDYATMWHVIAEVLLPLFHAALPWLLRGLDVAVAQPREQWSRPSPATQALLRQLGKDRLSCWLSKGRCLDTEFGRLAQRLFKGGFYGLDEDGDTGATVFTELAVGTPTNCETVWGSDALFVTAGLGGDLECDRLLWAWRHIVLRASGLEPAAAVPLPPTDPHVVWATRRNDIARHVVNEEEVWALLRQAGARVTVAEFRDPWREQMRLLQSATHFVCPHGAALVHGVFLRPQAWFITIDTHWPPFLALVADPAWTHRAHILGRLECNPKHPKNKKRCHIFRKPRELLHIHNVSLSEHNNHLSVDTRQFAAFFRATLRESRPPRHDPPPLGARDPAAAC